MMKKSIVFAVVFLVVAALISPNVFAENTAVHGDIGWKSAGAGLLSFLVWPGIGQYVNKNETRKNVTHAVLGLTGIFRFWSGWDALIDRQGGRWDGRI